MERTGKVIIFDRVVDAIEWFGIIKRLEHESDPETIKLKFEKLIENVRGGENGKCKKSLDDGNDTKS